MLTVSRAPDSLTGQAGLSGAPFLSLLFLSRLFLSLNKATPRSASLNLPGLSFVDKLLSPLFSSFKLSSPCILNKLTATAPAQQRLVPPADKTDPALNARSRSANHVSSVRSPPQPIAYRSTNQVSPVGSPPQPIALICRGHKYTATLAALLSCLLGLPLNLLEDLCWST